jgi:hypothetical protein
MREERWKESRIQIQTMTLTINVAQNSWRLQVFEQEGRYMLMSEQSKNRHELTSLRQRDWKCFLYRIHVLEERLNIKNK